MKLIVKIGIGVAAFISLPVVALAMWYVCMAIQTEPEIHLIPDGYRGPVVILFEKPNGDSSIYENDVRVYNISADGILRTQFHMQEGSINQKYYYVDTDGKRTELPVVRRKDQMTDSNQVYVFMQSYGASGIKPEAQQDIMFYMVGKITDDEQKWFFQIMDMKKGG